MGADAGVVNHQVAFPGKADADDEVAVGGAGPAAEPVEADRKADREAACNPVFDLGEVGQAGYVGAEAGEGAGVGGVEGPVAGPRPAGVKDRPADSGTARSRSGRLSFRDQYPGSSRPWRGCTVPGRWNRPFGSVRAREGLCPRRRGWGAGQGRQPGYL